MIIIGRVFRRARSYSTLQHSLVLAACAPDSSVPAGGTRHRTKTEGASFVRSRSLAAVARWRLWRGAETSSPQLLPYPLPTTKTTTTALYFPEPISVLVRCKDDGLLYKTHLRPTPPPQQTIPIQESVAFFHELRPRIVDEKVSWKNVLFKTGGLTPTPTKLFSIFHLTAPYLHNVWESAFCRAQVRGGGMNFEFFRELNALLMWPAS